MTHLAPLPLCQLVTLLEPGVKPTMIVALESAKKMMNCREAHAFAWANENPVVEIKSVAAETARGKDARGTKTAQTRVGN